MLRRFAPAAALLALLFAAPAARAQASSYQPIRVDVTVYGAYAPADAAAWGIGAAVEPKFNATDNLSVGLRLEGAGFVTQSVQVGSGGTTTSVSQSARAVTAALAKADLYLTTAPVRPFVGIAAGFYRIGSGSQSASSGGSVVQTASTFSGFGFAPQAGLNLGGFRLAATYHVITGGDIVVTTQAVGAPAPTQTKLSKNYFAFEIGGTFGGAKTGP